MDERRIWLLVTSQQLLAHLAEAGPSRPLWQHKIHVGHSGGGQPVANMWKLEKSTCKSISYLYHTGSRSCSVAPPDTATSYDADTSHSLVGGISDSTSHECIAMHLLVACVGSRRKYSSTDTRIFDLQVAIDIFEYQYTSTPVHLVHSSHSTSRHHPLASGPGQPQLGEHEHNLEAESPHIINTAPAPLASCRIKNDAQCNSWSRSVDSSTASDGTVACHTRLLIQHWLQPWASKP
ncbi:uncharacterized protein SEPMUDRAFT_109227 [Sphaerulina musiva SO2202]|uniref:Uncharacterized protein n=1 Tax=Sphaerulina musiva (strain SO2202) TaxID=692275 RepID=M3D1W9_SPHMS|nr:uncharacterized protein SEPMUDRAFT_109227 [Sphaerulina musiva SO2202]EMF11117.1 hypothetical protein SEPMUDRAFT_109227 [Sphaerulina musiva SO2202]